MFQDLVLWIWIDSFGRRFAESATSILRQLVDAEHYRIYRAVKIKRLASKGDDTPIAPGEFRDVDVTGLTIVHRTPALQRTFRYLVSIVKSNHC